MNPDSRHYKYVERSLYVKAQQLIANYFVNLPWSEEYECVADAGCGPGHITRHLVLKACPENAHKLYAFDLSKDMIRRAKRTNGHPQIEYVIADIDDRSSFPSDWDRKFTKIFSHFCLHWLKDFRQGIRNLHDILRPEGYLLAVIVVQADIWEVAKLLRVRPKWSPYCKDVKKYFPYLTRLGISSNEEMVDLFESVGFSTSLLERKRDDCRHASIEQLKESLRSLGSFYTEIPESLKEEFIEEYAQEIVQRTSGKFDIPTETLTLLAKKEGPKHVIVDSMPADPTSNANSQVTSLRM